MRRLLCIFLVIIITSSSFGCQFWDDESSYTPPEYYAVDSSSFTYNGFVKNSGQDFPFPITGPNSSASSSSKVEYTRTLTLNAICDVALVSYTYEAILYDEFGNILTVLTDTRDSRNKANEDIKTRVYVSDEVYSDVDKVWVNYTGKTDDETVLKDEYKSDAKINFVLDGEVFDCVNVRIGNVLDKPLAAPEKTNFKFDAWYTDPYLKKKYDFSDEIVGSVTLYAGFKIDYSAINSSIKDSVLRSAVTVYSESYDFNSSVTSQGSGVVFHIQDGYYYILTNWHVAMKKSGYPYQSIEVKDFEGNIYDAWVYENPNKECGPALSEKYDLAVIYIKPKTKNNITDIDFARYDPARESVVISIGSPNDVMNTVTFGFVTDYKKPNVNYEGLSADISFEIVVHNAYTDNGSSGGALINKDLKLVGINFAGNEGDTFEYAIAIPINKVIEFLKEYVYN